MMEYLIKRLHEDECSCVIENSGVVRTFTRRGVADLYDLLKTDSSLLQGASIADKVVGKGTAALMVQGGVRRVYADIIGISALALLRRVGVEVEFREVVPFIKNRGRNDWCPLEKLCCKTEEPVEMYSQIEEFIKRISQGV